MPNVHVRRLNTELFNSINLMHYWAETHGTSAPQSEEYQGHIDYDILDKGVTWARGNNLFPKGHPLFWPVPKGIPDWVKKYDYETRLKFLEVRVRQLVSRFRGRMSVYDAVNEMIWEPTFEHTNERHWPHIESTEDLADMCSKVLGWAREEDPDPVYLLNEYGILRGSTDEIPVDASNGKRINRDYQLDRFIALGKCLVDRGQQPDALGVQSLPGNWADLPMLIDTIDAIGEGTGLPIHITEARTDTKHLDKTGMPKDEVLARFAEYQNAVLTTVFGNPHLEAFYYWGNWDFYNGRKPTTMYQRAHDLIKKQWMTTETVSTDAKGVLRFRGFTGDYRLRIPRSSDQTTGYALSLPKQAVGGITQTLRLG